MYGCNSKTTYSMELKLSDFSPLSISHLVKEFQLCNLSREEGGAVGHLYAFSSKN